MKSSDHQQLMGVLNKLVTKEKWQRMPKKKGKVAKISITKSGNIKITLDASKGIENIFVLQKNKNLYETASELKAGDTISVFLRRYLGQRYCTKIIKAS